MLVVTEPKSFTARVPTELYEATRRLAEQRGVSVNALVQEGLRRLVAEEDEQAFYDSFTLLGEDAGMSDVGFAFAAQAEVVRRDRQDA